MKKVLLTLLAVIVVIGALAGAGYMGYRIGYNNGATGSGDTPAFGRFYRMDPNQMPMYRFDNGFDRGPGRDFGFNQRPMMRPGGFNPIGYGHYSPFSMLWNIAILGLVIWFVYWLFTKSGWQITRKMEADSKPDPVE